MKDLEQDKDVKVEEVSNQAQKKEIKFIGSMIKKKGHKLFEFDMDEFKVKELKPIKQDVELKENDFKKGALVSRGKRERYEYNDRCLYITALNIKNAARKFEKEIIKLGIEGLKNNSQE